LARLGMERPEVLDAAPREPLLEHRQVRIPAAAEILRSGAAYDPAVGDDQVRLVTLGSELIGDGAVLAALEGGFEQAGRLEPDHPLAPHRTLHRRIAFRRL